MSFQWFSFRQTWGAAGNYWHCTLWSPSENLLDSVCRSNCNPSTFWRMLKGHLRTPLGGSPRGMLLRLCSFWQLHFWNESIFSRGPGCPQPQKLSQGRGYISTSWFRGWLSTWHVPEVTSAPGANAPRLTPGLTEETQQQWWPWVWEWGSSTETKARPVLPRHRGVLVFPCTSS